MRVSVLTPWVHINIVRRRFAKLIIQSYIYGAKLYVKEAVVPERYGITFPLRAQLSSLHARIAPLLFRSSNLIPFASFFYREDNARPSGVDTCAHTARGLSDDMHGGSYPLHPTRQT
jgi:hypothetical protein